MNEELAGILKDVVEREKRYDLRALIEVQRVFNERLQRVKHGKGLDDLTDVDRGRIVKELVLLTTVELVEMLGHVNWKPHQKDRPRDRSKLLEEFVDSFKYLLNFFVYAPFGVDEFLEAFHAKSRVVEQRLAEEHWEGAR